jgi:hypothetical protein
MWMALLAIPFSALGSSNILQVGGRFLPEPYLITWVTLFATSSAERMQCTLKFAQNRSLWLATATLLFLGVLGLLRKDAAFGELYSSFRAAFALVVGFTLCDYHQKRATIVHFLDKICIFIALATIFTLAQGVSQPGTKIAINAPALMLATMYLIDQKKIKMAAVMLVVLSAAVILSFFRQNYAYLFIASLYFCMTSVSSILYNLTHLKMKKNDIYAISLFLLILVVLISQSGNIYNWMISDESRYAQSVHKYNQMIDMLSGGGGNSTDASRFEGISFFFKNLAYYIFPNGFVNQTSRETWSIWGGEVYITNGSLVLDSGLAYLMGQFGFIAIITLAIYFSHRFINMITLRGRSHLKLRSSILALTLLIPLFLDGGYFTQTERAFGFGVVIAMAFPRRTVALCPLASPPN